MNLQNIYEILEYGLEFEASSFEEWYSELTDSPIKVYKTPNQELEDVEELIGFLVQDKRLLNEDGDVGHIYFCYLLLLKDYLNECS